MGLCGSHYQQRIRGQPLSPLRRRPAEALVTLGLRVPLRVRDAASADPGAARAVLVAWVDARAARDAGARPTLAAVNKAVRAGRSKQRRWRCTTCGAVCRLAWTLPAGVACQARTARSSTPCGGGLVPASGKT